MTKKICKNCIYWQSQHYGYWEAETKGHCKKLSPMNLKDQGIYGLVEGCVSVEDRVIDFEFVTAMNFGCTHWEKK
jgi:hypothetical protein